jgi:uncharacterized protein
MLPPDRLDRENVLRVGEVTAVTGRRVFVAVDTDKNLSELFFDGDLLRNISVGSYIDIRKGFISLIGRVEGENAQTEDRRPASLIRLGDRRILAVVLVGFLDSNGHFFGGTKELPLVGNEAFILTRKKVHQVHSLVRPANLALNIARSEYEGYEIAMPVDGLMNSHIAIFGNTGSGKSNTLAMIYQEFIALMRARNAAAFERQCRIMLFDFNNEYVGDSCLTSHKKVFRLSTRDNTGDKIPLGVSGLGDIEIVSILADATEKTQKPFLRRVLGLQQKVLSSDNPLAYARNILQRQIKQTLQMSDKIRFDLLLDYFRQILPNVGEDEQAVDLAGDLEWQNRSAECCLYLNGRQIYLKQHPDQIENSTIYRQVARFNLEDDVVSTLITFAYIQLIYDILSNRAQNEHIAPAINKLRSKQSDIRKIFDPAAEGDLFDEANIAVIALGEVNLDMRKTIPLLLAKRVYDGHKRNAGAKTLSIIIDEAHNILSEESFRESENWKDYRLETFEEIIKEGRKFGVFVTISSQRPNDISHTITSQAHNYFIHRLINQKDLQSIASAVSYIDKLTEESIPTLPTGTCIFSGIAGQMPLKLVIHPLAEQLQPRSTTIQFRDLIPVRPRRRRFREDQADLG